jgi:hypothetical protein
MICICHRTGVRESTKQQNAIFKERLISSGGTMTKRLLASLFIAVLLSMPVHAGWIKPPKGQMPPNAFVAGKNHNGQPLYVCRVQYKGGVYPGMLAESSQGCNISYDEKEYSIFDYEILVGNGYRWVAVFNGEIPFDAFLGGMESQEKSIYVCRGNIDSAWCPGKISPSDGGCRVPHAGKELTALWYEVLVGS